MWPSLAVDAPAAPDPTSSGTWLFGVAAIIAALVPLVLSLIKNRQRDETSSSPPSPAGAEDGSYTRRLGERVAVNESELKGVETDLDEMTETVEIIDRRVGRTEVTLEQIVRHLNRDSPEWR